MLDNALWNVLAIIVAILIMIIFPIINAFEKEEQIIRLNVLSETDMFLDTIKSKGYIDRQDYKDFKRKLDENGYIFDVVFEHEKVIFVPVYGDPTVADTFTHSVKQLSEIYTDSEIKDYLFGEDLSNTENIYKMNRGDRFVVTVNTKTKTKSEKIKTMLLGIHKNNLFYVKLGGTIQNETY